ncbi:CotO family spore coat protein [Lentibacillus sp. CBA3610]|uniref:CotO family spore coat protein n=1 Tax=Lentibacillus sp. CBA3610 TaxID=2518176 RepID=UPI0015950485|nr:CotO family spore coat protein [Lentibacillus sp. CBA3610]QKY68624.1 hypothetical protein Len3610_02395 [Lentibacillus sp. CBA3610]
MGDKKVARSPLLYIQQPGIRTPEAPMQSHYRTPKRKRDNKKAESSTLKRQPANRNFFNKQAVNDEAEEEVESSEESSDHYQPNHTDTKSDQERKKFKDMSLKERVDYFLNSPKHVPVMRCEVKTDERNYRGRITDYQDDNVHMRVGRRTAEIPFNTIKEIRMIGF